MSELIRKYLLLLFVCLFGCNQRSVTSQTTDHPITSPYHPVTSQKPPDHLTLHKVECTPTLMCVTLRNDWRANPYGDVTIRSACDVTLEGMVTYRDDEATVRMCATKPDVTSSCTMSIYGNDTHIGYYNYVVAYRNSSVNSTTAPKVLPWRCIYENTTMTSSSSTSSEDSKLSPVVTQFLGNRTGEGQFQAAMFLYKDRDYRKVYDLSPVLNENSRLRVRVILVLGPLFTRLQIVRCWGTPTIDSNYDPRRNDEKNGEGSEFVLIDNYCPVPEAESKADVDLITNGEHNYAIWESLIFRFVSSSYLYLHCNVRICFENVNCTKDCGSNVTSSEKQHRNKREVTRGNDVIVSLGPIRPASRAMDVDGRDVIKKKHRSVNDIESAFPVHFTTIGIPLFLAAIFVTITCLLFFIYRKVITSTNNNSNSVTMTSEASNDTTMTKQIQISSLSLHVDGDVIRDDAGVMTSSQTCSV